MNQDDVRGKLQKKTETLQGLHPGLEEVPVSRSQRTNHLPNMGDWGKEGLVQQRRGGETLDSES